MKVKFAKTKAMIISDLKSYIKKAFFTDTNGSKIETGNDMKILGVHFSSDSDMSAQVRAIRAKF